MTDFFWNEIKTRENRPVEHESTSFPNQRPRFTPGRVVYLLNCLAAICLYQFLRIMTRHVQGVREKYHL